MRCPFAFKGARLCAWRCLPPLSHQEPPPRAPVHLAPPHLLPNTRPAACAMGWACASPSTESQSKMRSRCSTRFSYWEGFVCEGLCQGVCVRVCVRVCEACEVCQMGGVRHEVCEGCEVSCAQLGRWVGKAMGMPFSWLAQGGGCSRLVAAHGCLHSRRRRWW